LVVSYIPDSGDLIWIDFNPQVGHEQAGHRPAIVLSLRSFHVRTSLMFVCPITSRRKEFPFEVVLPPNLPVRGVVLCEHMRSMDWQPRQISFIGMVPDETLRAIRDVIAAIAGVNLE
jgi:mRNA interferase MazF